MGVVLDLVASQHPDVEIVGLWMREIDSAYRGRGPHGERFREPDARGGLGVQEIPDRDFFGVVGLGWVARRRPDAPVSLGHEILVREVLRRRVAPPFASHALVQVLGHRFGEPIGQRLGHDGGIIVVVGLEFGDQRVEPVPGRDRKEPNPVVVTFGRHEVRKGSIGVSRRLAGLLAQRMEHRALRRSVVIGPQHDVVPTPVGREESHDPAGFQDVLGNEPVEHSLGVGQELARLDATLGVVQDLRVLSAHFPGLEERRPVDVGAQGFDRDVRDRAQPPVHRAGARDRGPIGAQRVRTGFFDRNDLGRAGAPLVVGPDGLVVCRHGARETGLLVGREQGRGDPHGA